MRYLILLLLSQLFVIPSFGQLPSVKSQEQVSAFPVKDVTITGGDFFQAGKTDKKVMLSIVPDRLLYTFRKNAGIPVKPAIKPYGGWEAPEVALRGHTTGHYLSALSYWYAQEPLPAINQRITYIVSSLAECQDKLGNGYLSAFPEKDIDRVEKTGEGWAPHYTLHKILQGLLDAYTLTGNEQALKVATRFGDWFAARAAKISDQAHWAKVLDIIEQGGIEESLLNLYVITHDEKHKTAAAFFEQTSKIKPAAEGRDVLNKNITSNYQHANATIPQFIGALRKYEVGGDPDYLQAADFFWNQVTGHRAFSNGSTGYNEYWHHGPDTLLPELGIKAGETCCSYNLVKLSNDLFRMHPHAKYGDYVERALYNDILSAIHPETGGMMYFHTQQPGGFKTFGKNEEVFWCCTGTGMEDHVRYASSIYFHSKNDLYVNLYIPSRVKWKAKGISMEQITSFPDDEQSVFKISGAAARYAIHFRVPYWAAKGITVKVNGESITAAPDSTGFVVINRSWHNGDKVAINLPMQLHLQPLPDAPAYASVMYGPLVLAGELGREKMADSLIMTTDYFFGDVPPAYAATITVPALTGTTGQLSWIQKMPSTRLAFTTDQTSNGKPVKLVPVSRIYDQRFAAYWRFVGGKE